MTNRRGLLGGILSLPFLSVTAKQESFTHISSFGPARYAKALVGQTIGYGTTHLLKMIDPKTGIVSNELGLGVFYLDPKGIFVADEKENFR